MRATGATSRRRVAEPVYKSSSRYKYGWIRWAFSPFSVLYPSFFFFIFFRCWTFYTYNKSYGSTITIHILNIYNKRCIVAIDSVREKNSCTSMTLDSDQQWQIYYRILFAFQNIHAKYCHSYLISLLVHDTRYQVPGTHIYLYYTKVEYDGRYTRLSTMW